MKRPVANVLPSYVEALANVRAVLASARAVLAFYASHPDPPRAFGGVVVSTLRPAHIVWVLRRAAMLEGLSPDARDEPPDPARAVVLHRIAAKVSEALERSERVSLSPGERSVLITEAHGLTERATRELRRHSNRDLTGGEEWLLTAQALREVAEASRQDP